MISIIVSWCNRKELTKALPSLIQAAAEVSGDLTIVNLGGDEKFLDEQIGTYKDQIRLISLPHARPFSKPKAQNIGAAFTTKPFLFFCDCDIILPKGTLRSLLNEILYQSAFGNLAGVRETEVNSRKANELTFFGYRLQLKTKSGTEVEIIDNEEDAKDGTRQAPGLLLVKRKDFEEINGYNSQLKGWGWEDQDIICRLTLKRGLKRVNNGHAMHISHGDYERMKEYNHCQDRWESRDKMFRQALANYDQGNFQGTYVQDTALFEVKNAI